MRRNPLKHTKLFAAFISVFILVSSTNGNHVVNKDINNTNHINNYVGGDANVLKELRKQYIVTPTKKETISEENKPIFKVTSYDLSIQSCTKSRGESGFGITKNGTNLKNKSWENTGARFISVDPRIIPLNKKVRLTFIDPKHKKYSGNYTTVDIGSGIIGNRVDLFLGDFHSSKPSKKSIDFGVGYATVTILEN